MKPVTERPGGLLLIPVLIALLLTGTGCSMLIASHGVSSAPAIATGSTRQEVRETLGNPDSSETRSDGTRVETYRIRRKVESAWDREKWWESFTPKNRDGVAGMILELLYAPVTVPIMAPIMELYATGKAIADSEKQKFQMTLVYGPDDRLLYSYDMNTTPPAISDAARARFDAGRPSLSGSLWKQLESDECPKWSACFTSYAGELRRRATLVGYTLPAKEEENLQRLLDVAKARDEGRITQGQGLIGIAGRQGHPPSLSELDVALRRQLEADRCPSWVACVAFYADEVHLRAASESSTITIEEENEMRQRLTIAADMDQGRMTKTDALEALRRPNF